MFEYASNVRMIDLQIGAPRNLAEKWYRNGDLELILIY